ncbi:uncharacterized protein PRCAT00005699001 [Priceomyces carsonii]|uniref:uncharacterized protein n=1 Tax=Priceomyces carsonii TaxID=28549 RepID=UPI002EDA0527|nr:unnamed protein product [Priceomyces carsonii]
MITKYFTKVVVKFDPFSSSAKPARLFLSRIPTSMKGTCNIDYKVLTKESPINERPTIEVTFKDKHTMKADPETMEFKEVTEYFNGHSRRLALKEAISE